MTRRLTMVEALNEALNEELEAGNCGIVLGEDVRFNGGLFGVTAGLYDAFGPERVLDTPISEGGFAGLATGCAIAGIPAVVEIQIFDFVALAMDQIANHAAKLRYMTGGQIAVPLVIRGPTTSRIGLAAQHSQSLEGWFMNVAGLKVVTPATPADAKGLLKSAIRDPNPIVFIEHRMLYAQKGDVPDGADLTIPLGTARVSREGTDVSLLANSFSVKIAEAAAEDLAQVGISAEVVDLRTLKPLDIDAVRASVSKTHRVVVISEGNLISGAAAEVSARIAEDEVFWELDAPIRRVGAADVPVPYARELETEVLPQSSTVVATVEQLMRNVI